MKLADAPIQLLRCRPRQETWNFRAKEEKTKIYVSNLSTVIEKRQLRELFQQASLFFCYLSII